jgi:hypothetical protein
MDFLQIDAGAARPGSVDGEYTSDVLRELAGRVARALPRWDLAGDTPI